MDQSELEEQATAFISRFLASDEQGWNTLRAEGADLANRLRRKAIDLSYSKATEFSPKIRLYHQLAAKVALLAYGPNSQALNAFEKNVRYYRNFESTQALVDEYERFRITYIESESNAYE